MAIALQPLVDNGDGTVTATVAGVAFGFDTVNVLIASIGQDLTTAGYVQVATRTGNGSLTWNQAAGYYFAIAQDVGSNITTSLPRWFAMATAGGADTLHYRILMAIAARLSLLTFIGIPNGRVYSRAHAWDRGQVAAAQKLAYPCVVCSYGGMMESYKPTDGDISADQFGYPVAVTFQNVSNGNNDPNEAWLHQRYQGMAAFRNQRLAGVDEVMICAVEPLSIALPEMWLKEYDVGGFVVRARAMVGNRGLTT